MTTIPKNLGEDDGPTITKQIVEFTKTATTVGVIGGLAALAIKKFKLCTLGHTIFEAVMAQNWAVIQGMLTNTVLGIAGGVITVLTLINRYFNGSTNDHTSTSLKGKVVVVTGANTGIGFETVREMAMLDNPPTALVMAC